ncbi:hypothetical protein QWY31_16380 [Cytophagales bacterium LB-30]|uniref:Prepilin-type N-terminal cleavage/methylation domain-containing protein n=1 Tax=Shiella aurantiaca TaxID=3058365 RepID=A0ABT8F9P5_9BACT|nr:hypothetical protein [Shiella aurantiaca]MDN4167089.1 hypothetical protein [Shiella aurantiaca]
MKAKHYIRASSTLEVTVALLIISITIAMALQVYTQVYFSNFTSKGLIANERLHVAMAETIRDQSYLSESYYEADIRIDKRIAPDNSSPKIIRVTLTAYDAHEKILAQHKRLIYVAE